MAEPDDIIRVGPLTARLGNVAAYLYLQEGEEHPVDLETVQTFLEGLGTLLNSLKVLHYNEGTWTEDNVQYEFYEAAKATFGEDKASIRVFFRMLYQLVTQTPNGPRWSQFVMIFGLDNFLDMLQARFDNPLGRT